MNAELAPGPTPAARAYQVNDLIIDVGVRRVTRNGIDLEISGRAFDLLVALVRAAPNLMSTRELLEGVWPRIIVGTETVTQCVMRLRQSLGDSAENPRYVVAVRGHGYRMAAEVRVMAVTPPASSQVAVEAPVGAPAGGAAPETVPATVPVPPAHKIRHWMSALLVLAVLVGISAAWWGLRHRSAVQTAASSEPRPASPAVAGSSVAVMPFANLTGEPSKDYLGDGMAEELINALAQVRGLKVPARTSAFAYKGRNVDIRRVAQNLGVAMILEGSVRSAGARVRISARLVDAKSGYQVWSQDYDRQSADIFKLQDDLAAEIVQALRGFVHADLRVPPSRIPPSRDVQAYDLYLQARSINRGTASSIRQALPMVNQALVRDPDFADAYASRAMLLAGSVVFGMAPSASLDGAEDDAVRALALNPNLAEAHTAREAIFVLRGHWVEAESSFRAAMVTAADDPYIRNYHTLLVLGPVGRLQQARSELDVSYHLAPGDGYTMHELAVTESARGHDVEALKFTRLWEELNGGPDPTLWDIALVYARAATRSGQYAEASERVIRALPDELRSTAGERAVRAFYTALADPAKTPAAALALRGFMPQLYGGRANGRTKMFFVNALAMIGDLDAAYELAGRLADRRAGMPGRIDWSDAWTPEMRPFRQDPRFAAFAARLGLMEYWQQYGPPDECDVKDDELICR
jgi:TolB-like protein/DNA-binding winged helix-turn-helix (wHTH) protein